MNWWKRITGIARLERECSYLELARQHEAERADEWRKQAEDWEEMAAREIRRANLAAAEYNKMEEVIRANSARVGEWAQEKMRLTHTIETLERKVDNLKIAVTDSHNGAIYSCINKIKLFDSEEPTDVYVQAMEELLDD